MSSSTTPDSLDNMTESQRRWHSVRQQLPHIPERVQTCRELINWLLHHTGATDMEKQAASFLIEVWHGEPAHEINLGLPAFDMFEVAARGDVALRNAVSLFVADPFWP